MHDSQDITMASFSPLSTSLNKNILTGPNYVDWKNNLYLGLMAEEYIIGLREKCPVLPDEAPTLYETRAYNS